MLDEIVSKMAKEKQKESGGAVIQKSVEPPINPQNELAKIAKVSHDRMAKVKVIQENVTAEQNDKLDGD